MGPICEQTLPLLLLYSRTKSFFDFSIKSIVLTRWCETKLVILREVNLWRCLKFSNQPCEAWNSSSFISLATFNPHRWISKSWTTGFFCLASTNFLKTNSSKFCVFWRFVPWCSKYLRERGIHCLFVTAWNRLWITFQERPRPVLWLFQSANSTTWCINSSEKFLIHIFLKL